MYAIRVIREMEKKPFLILGLLCSFLFFSGAAHAASDEEFRIWNYYDIDKKINERWTFSLGEELRFEDNATQFTYHDTHASINHKTFSFLTLRAEYKNVRAKRDSNQWKWEYRPRIDVIPNFDLKGFVFKNRNRFEFRIKENKKNTFRYRNRISLDLPYKWTRFELQPYFSNEIFIETNKNGLIKDRFYAGFKMHLFKNVYGAIYYLRQFDKDSDARWTETNVLVTSLRLKF